MKNGAMASSVSIENVPRCSDKRACHDARTTLPRARAEVPDVASAAVVDGGEVRRAEDERGAHLSVRDAGQRAADRSSARRLPQADRTVRRAGRDHPVVSADVGHEDEPSVADQGPPACVILIVWPGTSRPCLRSCT